MRNGNIETLDMLVVAMCADYARRAEAISVGSYSKRTLMEYRYLNFRIYDAAAEIAGEAHAELFINEIGKRIGYASSELYEMSEATYKKRKSEIKRGIAVKLHLCD